MATALRPMLSVAREEVAVLALESAVTARTSVAAEASASARAVVAETALNPVVARQAAEETVLRSGPHLPLSSTLNTTSEITSLSTRPISPAKAESLVEKALEKDLGVTLRETMANAGQTGVEETSEQVTDAVKALLEGKGQEAKALSAKQTRVLETSMS